MSDTTPGHVLELRRRGLGISRTRLAGFVGCSPAMLQMLEHGYQPKHSSVLPRVVAELDRLELERRERRP